MPRQPQTNSVVPHLVGRALLPDRMPEDSPGQQGMQVDPQERWPWTWVQTEHRGPDTQAPEGNLNSTGAPPASETWFVIYLGCKSLRPQLLSLIRWCLQRLGQSQRVGGCGTWTPRPECPASQASGHREVVPHLDFVGRRLCPFSLLALESWPSGTECDKRPVLGGCDASLQRLQEGWMLWEEGRTSCQRLLKQQAT